MLEAIRYFKGKKVFITGHTGFKGSWLTYLMNLAGAKVTGYSLPNPAPNSHYKQLDFSSQEVIDIENDIRNAENLREEIARCQPDVIFHLAAQALVKKSYTDPAETFETNVMGSVNVLNAARTQPSIDSFVYITSDKCYENVEWLWGYRENDRIGGRDPYSASKGAAELVFSSFFRSYFQNSHNMAIGTTRAGNVIGGGDWAADRIIPDCMRAIKSKQSIVLRNPLATRPWQHVLEPLSGYLLLAAAQCKFKDKLNGEAWNFGPSTTEVRTVEEVTREIIKYMGQGAYEVQGDNVHHEANLLQLNCDKAKQLLGWNTRWNVEKTLQETAGWYKRVFEGESVREVTKSQILDYFPELK